MFAQYFCPTLPVSDPETRYAFANNIDGKDIP